jgi:hypothetical protein
LTDIPARAQRLLLIIDHHQGRLDVTARAIRAAVPDARLLLARAVRDITSTASPRPDVILVRTDLDGWAAASVLAAHRRPLPGRTVDAFLVAEGPLNKFSVLITDFPGLRLLPPDPGLSEFLAELVREAVRHNAGA